MTNAKQIAQIINAAAPWLEARAWQGYGKTRVYLAGKSGFVDCDNGVNTSGIKTLRDKMTVQDALASAGVAFVTDRNGRA